MHFSFLEQWSPTFLAPGTQFLEDTFSTDRARKRRVRCKVSDGQQQLKFAPLYTTHLLPCDPVPNSPRTIRVWPGSWGPLI